MADRRLRDGVPPYNGLPGRPIGPRCHGGTVYSVPAKGHNAVVTLESTMDATTFPTVRLRRLRYHPAVRRMIRQVELSASHLVLPLFVHEGLQGQRPIASMPGQFQFSCEAIADEVHQATELGIGGVLLFGIPAEKDDVGSRSWDDDGLIPRAIRAVREAAPGMLITTDVCFCEYTDHGHCGVADPRTGVDNDPTLALLGRQAACHARAGADMVAPSGMIDGMVAAIRRQLDTEGFTRTPILSYAAKYASAFYGPFRDAADSAPQFGDRRSYQMDPAAGWGQALREVELDLAEGADMVMVKPALAYLDIVRLVRDRFPGVPLAAYNVSGEYSMVQAAAERGWIDRRAVVLESLTAIRRAGAEIVITYWAKDVARWMKS